MAKKTNDKNKHDARSASGLKKAVKAKAKSTYRDDYDDMVTKLGGQPLPVDLLNSDFYKGSIEELRQKQTLPPQDTPLFSDLEKRRQRIDGLVSDWYRNQRNGVHPKFLKEDSDIIIQLEKDLKSAQEQEKEYNTPQGTIKKKDVAAVKKKDGTYLAKPLPEVTISENKSTALGAKQAISKDLLDARGRRKPRMGVAPDGAGVKGGVKAILKAVKNPAKTVKKVRSAISTARKYGKGVKDALKGKKTTELTGKSTGTAKVGKARVNPNAKKSKEKFDMTKESQKKAVDIGEHKKKMDKMQKAAPSYTAKQKAAANKKLKKKPTKAQKKSAEEYKAKADKAIAARAKKTAARQETAGTVADGAAMTVGGVGLVSAVMSQPSGMKNRPHRKRQTNLQKGRALDELVKNKRDKQNKKKKIPK